MERRRLLLNDTDAITVHWRDAAVEVRDEFHRVQPRSAVVLDQLLSGEIPRGFQPVGPWGSGVGGALKDPDFDPANLGGCEGAAARCLAKFYRGEGAYHNGCRPDSDYEYAWQILRRLPLAGDDEVREQERGIVDRAAFACGLAETPWPVVRAALVKRIPVLHRLALSRQTQPNAR